MLTRLLAAALAATLLVLPAAADASYPRFPALSPDGSQLSFTWADDVWLVDSSGGQARRVTAHPAQEGRSAFSPDGATLAFESNRDGARNLYTITLDPPAAPQRVTTSDRAQSLSGFTNDGHALLFSASQEPSLYRHARMYRAPLDGSTVQRLTDAYGADPREASNGDILFARGYPYLNRPQYRGPGARSIWRFTPDANAFEQLSTFNGNEFDPHQLPDGSVVFISSRTGDNNVYRLTGSADGDLIEQLTNFEPAPGDQTIGHGVRHLAVSADGSTAAFTVWDALYTLDLSNPDAQPARVNVTVSADDAVPTSEVHDLSNEAEEVALHPSGDAVAIVARGELFIRSTDEDHPARRITSTSAREQDLAWSPDGQTLYFVRDDEGGLGSIFTARVELSRKDILPASATPPAEDETPDADDSDADDADADNEPAKDDKKDDDAPNHGERWAEALTFDVQPLIDTPSWERAPLPSPDGAYLLYTRGLGDLVRVSLDTMEEVEIFEGWNAPDAQWLGDSRHIVYAVSDLNFNSDIFLQDVSQLGDNQKPPVNLTRHPDNDRSPRVSADGRVLTFLSERDSNNWSFDVYAIYLDQSLETMRPYQLAEHYTSAAKAAKKRKPLAPDAKPVDPFEFLYATRSLEDAYLRVRRLTSLPGSESSLAITPAGDRVLFEAVIDDDRALYSVDHRGEDRKTVAKGNVSDVTVSLTGEKAAYLKSGKATLSPIKGGDADTLPVDHDIRVDVAEEQRQKFREAAGRFGATFYHPTLKGLDWPALTAQYAELIARTRTPAEFNSVFTLLLGEVEGSHTAIRGGPSFDAPSPATGYLGIDVSPLPAMGGYRVDRVLPAGPSYIAPLDDAGLGLRRGDVVTAINSQPLLRDGVLADFHTALAGTRGEETLLSVMGEDDAERYALVTPSSFGAENNLRYDTGILDRRAEVERLSDGRLGYLHIRGMNMPSVRDFERDLFAAADGKEALIIDVRDNGGGSTADILLASLTAPRHAYTVPRGADAADVPHDAYPRDRRLIYGWSRPINVLINENSFSNAEIFAHSIKTIGRGTLVGKQTFGGVISTGGFALIDGTWVRQPFRGWYLTDGTDMESNGAMPDVPVEQMPDHEASGQDPQLEAAVRELLGRLDD